MAASKKITEANFTFDKSTKNTHRFLEDGDPESHKIGSIYVKKTAMPETPSKVKVVLTDVS